MEIILSFVGFISLISSIVATYYGIKLKSLEVKQKNSEIEREKRETEKTEKQNKTLDEKLGTQHELMKKDIKTLMDLINFVGEKVDKTNERIDILSIKFENHEGESNVKKKFAKVFRYAEIVGIDSWVTDERTEKYKVILENWFRWICKLTEEHFDSKTNKIGLINEYDPEGKMIKLIDDFYNLCSGYANEYVSKESFKSFLEVKKNIHAKSLVLSLEFKINNKTPDQVNEIVGSYLITFSNLFKRAVNDWLKLYDKQYVPD